jgi:hypothetical protein
MTTANIKQDWARNQNKTSSNSYTDEELSDAAMEHLFVKQCKFEVLHDVDNDEYQIVFYSDPCLGGGGFRSDWQKNNPTDEELYAMVDKKFHGIKIVRMKW